MTFGKLPKWKIEDFHYKSGSNKCVKTHKSRHKSFICGREPLHWRDKSKLLSKNCMQPNCHTEFSLEDILLWSRLLRKKTLVRIKTVRIYVIKITDSVHMIKDSSSYCPHPKDGEGNVFTGVCLSTPRGYPISIPCPFWGGTPVPNGGTLSWDRTG